MVSREHVAGWALLLGAVISASLLLCARNGLLPVTSQPLLLAGPVVVVAVTSLVYVARIKRA